MNSTEGKKIIQTEAAPQAIGPYSQAVRTGNMVYTAGQIGQQFLYPFITTKTTEYQRKQ